ncbi:hypothetical protein DPV78_009397 [Talaromyces pinophilus]|nr:hypothetical protein DPV78_009397 [Talaromyces pinophilus]
MPLSSSEQTVPEGKVRLLGLREIHEMLISFQVISTFESLPIEIHILVLMETPDFDCLESILRSCKKCYAAYLNSPRSISRAVRDNQWPGHFVDPVDALTAVRSKGLWFRFHKEEARSLLDTWGRREEPSFQLDEPTIEEQAKINQLYCQLEFFLKDYAKVVPRPEWVDSTKQHRKPLHLCLSNTEKRHFLRGLCRLIIFCNIFGAIEETIDGPELNFDEENAWFDDRNFDPLEYGLDPELFLWAECIPRYSFWKFIAPWECEEIGCVLEYFLEKYKHISEEICVEFLRLRSQCPEEDSLLTTSLEDLPPGENGSPPRYGYIENIYQIEDNLFKDCFALLISIGPGFLYRLLNAKYRDRRDMVFVNSKYPYNHHFIDCFYDFNVQEWQWGSEAKWKGHNIPITEKYWSTLPPHKKPNIAWQWQWMDSRTGLIWPVKRKRLSREDQIGMEWGCSIWDEERLEGWNTD